MEENAPPPRPDEFVFAFLDLGRTITGKVVYLLMGSGRVRVKLFPLLLEPIEEDAPPPRHH
uniref:Uncharacterized protein n=1 Tax=Solanum tuberosum TaxID=4113 RepID=M0ZIG3_SOLTU